MRSRLFTHRTGRWLVLAVLLTTMLLPSIAQWLGSDNDRLASQICSATGLPVWAHATTTPGRPARTASGDDAPILASLEACPWCSLQHALPPLPAPMPVLALLPLGDALPTLFLTAPRTLHAWRTAQPRGPPTAA